MLPGRWLWPPVEHGGCHISLLESHCFSVLCKYPDPKGFMCEDACVCLCVCLCVWRPEPAIKCLPKYCGRIFDLNMACPHLLIQSSWPEYVFQGSRSLSPHKHWDYRQEHMWSPCWYWGAGLWFSGLQGSALPA